MHNKEYFHRLEKYPHSNRWKSFIDNSICFIGVLGGILVIPQIFKIWIEKEASGVSLFSWIAYVCFAFIWLIYGIAHEEKAIIITYSLKTVLDFMVVLGVIIYSV